MSPSGSSSTRDTAFPLAFTRPATFRGLDFPVFTDQRRRCGLTFEGEAAVLAGRIIGYLP